MNFRRETRPPLAALAWIAALLLLCSASRTDANTADEAAESLVMMSTSLHPAVAEKFASSGRALQQVPFNPLEGFDEGEECAPA